MVFDGPMYGDHRAYGGGCGGDTNLSGSHRINLVPVKEVILNEKMR